MNPIIPTKKQRTNKQGKLSTGIILQLPSLIRDEKAKPDKL